MVRMDEFYFDSNDNKTKIKCMMWSPKEEEPKAILQIVHGMTEHISRYDEFANYLVQNGYAVVGCDLLGHGESVVSRDDWGYFCEDNPVGTVLADVHQLRNITQEKYKNVPYFLLGHSMGSFITRNYIALNGIGLAGSIIMGTGDMGDGIVGMGIKLTSLMAKFRGWRFRSKFVSKLVTESNGKGYENDTYSKSWLSKDREKVTAYYNDPACCFRFTLNGFLTLFQFVKGSKSQDNIDKIPKELPVLIVSGEDDVVGEKGKAVLRVYKKYEEAGLQDITWKLYKDDRHEILNETDRDTVFKDIESWMNIRL